ncbi:MAG: cobalamin-dependent protein [Spirochaetia bacterium]
MTADFASRLKALRVGRGMRQKDLALALGLAQTTIANYEQKLRFPDEPTLVKIADCFGVSLDHLLGRDRPAPVSFDPGMGHAYAPSEPLASGLALEYIQLLRGRGIVAAQDRLGEAMAGGMGIQDLYLRVFAPALEEVGRLWALGELSVGEEHSFSEATLRLMARLAPPASPGVTASSRGRCVVLAVPGELHLIGARMVADLISLEGFDVRFLGGNLSIGNVLEALRAEKPALLALSATLREHLHAMEDTIRAVRSEKALAGIRILVGGRAFDGEQLVCSIIGADAFAARADEAASAALRLTGHSR